MGTNYYMLAPGEHEARHLGKLSAGWRFTFRIYPELGIVNLQSWLAQLDTAIWIADEYDDIVSKDELLAHIKYAHETGKSHAELIGYTDDQGNTFTALDFS